MHRNDRRNLADLRVYLTHIAKKYIDCDLTSEEVRGGAAAVHQQQSLSLRGFITHRRIVYYPAVTNESRESVFSRVNEPSHDV